MLNNIIQNSIKYTAKTGGQIKMMIEEENGNIQFSIKDKGVGINKYKLD